MAPLIGDLSVHTVYLAMSIGADGTSSRGTTTNDSGFWIVKEIGSLTQEETFKIWTALTTIVAITGFVVTMVISTIFPMA